MYELNGHLAAERFLITENEAVIKNAAF